MKVKVGDVVIPKYEEKPGIVYRINRGVLFPVNVTFDNEEPEPYSDVWFCGTVGVYKHDELIVIGDVR